MDVKNHSAEVILHYEGEPNNKHQQQQEDAQNNSFVSFLTFFFFFIHLVCILIASRFLDYLWTANRFIVISYSKYPLILKSFQCDIYHCQNQGQRPFYIYKLSRALVNTELIF